MTPDLLLRTAILPACAFLAKYGVVNSAPAQRFLLAIAIQESGLLHRRQVSADGTESGPAASFWQGEKGGGICTGLLAHRGAAPAMRAVCDAFSVAPNAAAVWEAIRYQDIVAAAGARLLISTLPQQLPATADEGWAQYVSAWRPGKPHPEKWASCWAVAGATMAAL